MKILLDTHAMLWFLEGDPRLGLAAAEAIAERDNEVYFSVASHWELCIKISLGKIGLAESWQSLLENAMRDSGIRWLDIAPVHCQNVVELPFHHRDPFDRMLIAQAVCETMVIATHDRHFGKYPATIVW